MKKVFDAANNVEAHMVLHMLENQGIEGRIEGEHLSGGVGELPVTGLVRVLVNDADVPRARSIIDEWEKKQPGEPAPGIHPRARSAGLFLLGCLVGGGVVSWASWAPANPTTQDFNGDGKPDEVATYQNGVLAQVEEDRNLDGRMDSRWEYDAKGQIQRYRSDDDFDGVFEGTTTFERDLPTTFVTNRGRDARVDFRMAFTNGVLRSQEIVDAASGHVVKRYSYADGLRLTREEYDADGDGILETLRRYDDYQEIVSTTRQ
jgi:hypothetical protein